jgi:hypothetical protein
MFCLSIEIASKILMELLTELIIQQDLQVRGFQLSKISPYFENWIDLPLYFWSIQRQFYHQNEIRFEAVSDDFNFKMDQARLLFYPSCLRSNYFSASYLFDCIIIIFHYYFVFNFFFFDCIIIFPLLFFDIIFPLLFLFSTSSLIIPFLTALLFSHYYFCSLLLLFLTALLFSQREDYSFFDCIIIFHYYFWSQLLLFLTALLFSQREDYSLLHYYFPIIYTKFLKKYPVLKNIKTFPNRLM